MLDKTNKSQKNRITTIIIAMAFLFNSICLAVNLIMPSLKGFGDVFAFFLLLLGLYSCFPRMRVNKGVLSLCMVILIVVVTSFFYYGRPPEVLSLLVNYLVWGVGISIVLLQSFDLTEMLNVSMWLSSFIVVISFLDGRCAVIPLSGGHDSRLLAFYLRELGYHNVYTYTYGPCDSYEVTTSEKVARYLGLKWMYVEYEPPKLRRFFDESFYDLMDYYCDGVSSVCIQDLYAVKYLHDNRIVPENSVFVPGHSFDLVAGGHILSRYVKQTHVSADELVCDIIWKHYSERKRSLPSTEFAYYSELILKSLQLDSTAVLPVKEACRLYYVYNICERQAKYVCANVRTYEYYGYDWYLPLWDEELVAFWEGIDIEDRYNRKLFFEFTEYRYPGLMQAAPVLEKKLKKETGHRENPIYRLCRKIRQLVYYREFHYCFAYFHRLEVYKIFLQTHFLNIGLFVNKKMKKMMGRKTK